MFRNYALISLTLVFAAIGCSKDEGNKSSDKKVQDLTDTSSCHGNPPANASVYSTWSGKFGSGGNVSQMSFTFTGNNVATVTMTCSNGETGSASSRISVTNNQVQFLEAANGGPQSCSVNIPANFTLSYGLIGNCIQLSDGKESHLLVNVTAGLTNQVSSIPLTAPGAEAGPAPAPFQDDVFIQHHNDELPPEE